MTVPFNGNGSGIILSQDGYIVTNNHVIETVAERGGEITIRLASGKEYTNVTVVGRDPQTDLAVLKVHGANNLPTAELGDSDKLRVGDWAIAIGNPLGFNSSVTLGIISALNRRNFRNDAEALERVIQTDAAINPGNSGGALADVEGRVVGINTAIASANGGNVGIGFAIPINSARTVIDQLIQQGRVMRPYLGIVYVALENIKAEELPGVTLPEDRRGVIIIAGIEGNAVRAGSPADRAGLQEGDIIRQIDGKQVEGIHSIREEVQKRGVGETITLTIWRNGQTMTVPVTLDEMPEDYTLRNFGNNPFP
jgi:serine protease Do